MDFLFRAWKQNIRKPAKSFMIFLVMFVISNLIVTGIFILKGTQQATDATMSKITPIVYYTQDWDRYYRAQELGFITWETDPMPNISQDIAKQISEMDDVKSFDISNEGTAMIRSIKPYKDPNSDGSMGGGGIMFDENGNQVEYYEPEYFDLIGTSSSEFKVANGTIEMVSGRGISLDDVNTENRVIMLEERLAKANDLSVGDKLTIDPNVVWDKEQSQIPSEFEEEFEIVGIFKNLVAQDQNDTWMNERAAKQIYIPYNVLNQFNYNLQVQQIQDGIEQGYYTQEEADQYITDIEEGRISTIGFLLNDPLTVRDFIADATRLLPSEYHMLKVANTTFDSIAKSVDSMTQTSNLIIYIVFGAGILILSLITSLTLKSREYEIGVLLSLGESKVKVIGQLMSELLIIALVAFSLSIVSGNFIAKYYGQELLKTQMENTMSSSSNMNVYIPDQMYGTQESSLQYSDFVSNFNIKLDPMVYGELMIYGMLVVGISTFIPIIFIMRYNPKTILSIR